MANDINTGTGINIGGENLQVAAWAAVGGGCGVRVRRGAYETAPPLTVHEDGREVWFKEPSLRMVYGKITLKAGDVEPTSREIPAEWLTAMRQASLELDREQKRLTIESKRRNRGGSW